MTTLKNNAPFFVDNEVIILSKNGLWLADGIEITHDPTRRLFAKSLKKDKEGYYLSVGRETKRIQVEDTAYFVQRLEGNPTDGYTLILSDDSREPLLPQTLKYRPGRLTCQIKEKSEEAKFLHIPYFDLLKYLQEDQQGYFLDFGPPGNNVRVLLSHK